MIILSNGQYREIIEKIDSYAIAAAKAINLNISWSKEFQRLAMSSFLSGPKKKIYGLVYAKKSESFIGLRKLILSISDTFEEAQTKGIKLLENSNENPNDWSIEIYQSIEIPIEQTTKVDDIVKQLDYQKPIDVYLNDLELAKSRFCDKKEAKVLDGV